MEDYKKKYEQAMLRMNKWVEGSEIIDPKEVAEFVFPELRESEDERTRKEIIQFLQLSHPQFVGKRNHEKWIAWIEKQSDDFEEERVFRPLPGCDIYSAAKSAVERQKSGKKIILAFNEAYIPVDRKTADEIVYEYYYWLEKQGEQKSTDEVEPEPYFYCKYGGTIPLCSDCKRNHINSPFKTEEITTWHVPSKSTKRCIDYIVWPENQDKQKSTWSEEDEKQARQIERIVHDNGCTHQLQKQIADWLKSLKERMKEE